MPRRVIEVDGERWTVSLSGRITQYLKDEFGLGEGVLYPCRSYIRCSVM